MFWKKLRAELLGNFVCVSRVSLFDPAVVETATAAVVVGGAISPYFVCVMRFKLSGDKMMMAVEGGGGDDMRW